MLSKALIEHTKGRWREFKREPSAMLWVVLMPLLWMGLLGFAFSKPPSERYGVAVEPVAGSSEFLTAAMANLNASKQLKLVFSDATEREQIFQRGEAVIAVHLGLDSADYYYDRNNPESRRALQLVNNLVQSAGGRVDPIPTREVMQETPGTRYIDFLIPGLLGLSIMTSSLFGVGLTIVSNRRENLLKRYLATPMQPSTYLISHIFGRMMVLAVEFVAILASGWLIFRFTVAGQFLSFVTLAILGAASFTALALLCASRTKSVPMMAGMINLICVPFIFLSGVFFSKTNFPDWTVPVINLLPLTALNDALRKVALQGLGLADVLPEISVLLAMAVICTAITSRTFKWY